MVAFLFCLHIEFECNGFIAVRFRTCTRPSACSCTRAAYTAAYHGPSCIRHVHGRVHCTRASTRPVHGRLRPRNGCVHVCTCTRVVYTVITRPCTRRVHGRKTAVCTAVYTAAYTARRVYGTCTTVYMGRHGLYRAHSLPFNYGRITVHGSYTAW